MNSNAANKSKEDVKCLSSLRDMDLKAQDDLRDVTHLQVGRLKLNIEPCDLVALTRRVVRRLQITTKKHRLQVHTRLHYLIVLVDALRMEQVLINLLKNVIKYSPDGGRIDLEITEGHESVQVRVAVLLIKDYGIGMPDEQPYQVFGCASRAENALTFKGSSPGFYVSRSLIEQQAGYIWFDAVEQQGTTLYITLPAYA
ncbi:hypothetical protein KDA_62010 [Dictyobacter alpinus]|uniref:histidine kinase n=1 Tax=Dictyobacter alpinus TaxID=2014873 RepID=A0A402BHI6_9CHLR|nr:ATP-binding protein [Dictyobacter alpinus]GCE30717.1 hypothetical protein KDA_62010 [Dictyobacter alpinus]